MPNYHHPTLPTPSAPPKPHPQPAYVHPLNLSQEEYASLRTLIKSHLHNSPGLPGAGPANLQTFNTWFGKLLQEKIIPHFFSDEREGKACWGRDSITITRAVRRCVLRIADHMRRGGAVGRGGVLVNTAEGGVSSPRNDCDAMGWVSQGRVEEDYYPEERALSPGEGVGVGGCADSSHCEQFVFDGGVDFEGYLGMSDEEFIREFIRSGSGAFPEGVMQG